MIELETRRLRIATPTPADAEAMLRYAVKNRDILAPWEPERSAAYFELAYWEAEVVSRQIESGERIPFLVRERDAASDAILGRCTVSNVVRGAFHSANLGYSLDRDAWGRGLMGEAVGRVVDYAFGELRLHRLSANYMPRNERSGRLLRALGFRVEGYARDYLRIGGVWEDHILTALTNESWSDE